MTSPAQDLATVRGALAGDRKAGARLADRLCVVPRIVSAINSRRGGRLSSHDIEDLVGDLVVVIWRKLSQYEGKGAFNSWLYRFCELEYLNVLRRRGRASSIGVLSGEEVDIRPEGSSVDSEALEHALTDLGPPEEDLVRLKHFEDLSFTQIGQRLGMSANTAKTRYYRGIQWLRQRLSGTAAEIS